MARTKKQSLEKVSERKRQIRLEIEKESLNLTQNGANGLPPTSTSSHSCNGKVALGSASADCSQSAQLSNHGIQRGF